MTVQFSSLRALCIGGLVLNLAVSAPDAAMAQTAADSALIEQQQRQIERRFEQQRAEQLRQLRQQAPLPTHELRPVVPKAQKIGECLEIQQIVLTGVTVFSVRELHQQIAPYQQRCLYLSDIKALLAALTQFYVAHGYVAARALLPQSLDTTDGVLRLHIVEGMLDTIKTNKNDLPRSGLDTPFAGQQGKPVNVFDLEQGLEQINRLRAYQAAMALEPGDRPASSNLVVDIRSQKRWRAHMGLDNGGSVATGEKQLEWSAGIDDGLGLYESVDVTMRHDGESNTPSTRSRQLTIRMSVPYGRWQGRYLGSYHSYRSLVRAFSQDFQTSGRTWSHTVELERSLIRTAHSQTAVSAKLTHKDTQNHLEGLLLRASSRTLSIAGFGVTHHQQNLFGGTLNVRAELEKGLKLFGALEDRQITASTPQAQFFKTTMDIEYSRWMRVFTKQLLWQSWFSGQWTSDTLYSSERLTLGGQYTVRGFDEESLSGDVGGTLRSEVIYPLKSQNAVFTKITGNWQAYAGIDTGWLRHDRQEAQERGHISGVALGLRSHGGLWFADVAYEQRLKAPDFLEDEGEIWRLRVGVNL